jgi:hypothetical protein
MEVQTVATTYYEYLKAYVWVAGLASSKEFRV